MRRVSDGADVPVVSVPVAARLVKRTKKTLEQWVAEGKVAICYTPDSDVRVFVDSLWAHIAQKEG